MTSYEQVQFLFVWKSLLDIMNEKLIRNKINSTGNFRD